jgi:hypothetical protein
MKRPWKVRKHAPIAERRRRLPPDTNVSFVKLKAETRIPNVPSNESINFILRDSDLSGIASKPLRNRPMLMTRHNIAVTTIETLHATILLVPMFKPPVSVSYNP